MKGRTNIQDLYENLIDNKKELIIFGIGYQVQYCISQINQVLNVICDNWSTPYYLEDSKQYPYTVDNIINHIGFAIDNDEEKVKKGYFDLEGKKIKVYSANKLNEIDKSKYIVLITTKSYQDDIKRQIHKMDKKNVIECYGFFSDVHHFEKKNRGLLAERIIMPYMELIKQPYYQKNRELCDKDEYNRLLEYISAGKYVNNIIGFEITTVCNLNCENCADYIPRLKRHEHIPTEMVLNDIDTFFKAVDFVFCVTLVSGEVLFHPGIKEILNKLISLDKVERIDLVTNGVRCPEDEELLNILAHKKIMIHMSNYNMPEKTDISRAFYAKHGIDIRFLEEQVKWKRVNPVLYKRNYDKEDLENAYLKCNISRVCPQIIRKGKIYLCGRVIRYKQLEERDFSHDYIDIHNCEKQELKTRLINFKLESYAEACDWCDWCEYIDAEIVKPGEQGKV